MIFNSNSTDDTMRLGARIGKLAKPGAVIALIGDLGAGKTTFAKGVAKGLGIRDWEHLVSPSFVVAKEYNGGRIPLYHIDLYRLGERSELFTVGMEEYIWGRGITLIEWADRAPGILPKELLEIELVFKNQMQRRLKLKAKGRVYKELVKRIIT